MRPYAGWTKTREGKFEATDYFRLTLDGTCHDQSPAQMVNIWPRQEKHGRQSRSMKHEF